MILPRKKPCHKHDSNPGSSTREVNDAVYRCENSCRCLINSQMTLCWLTYQTLIWTTQMYCWEHILHANVIGVVLVGWFGAFCVCVCACFFLGWFCFLFLHVWGKRVCFFLSWLFCFVLLVLFGWRGSSLCVVFGWVGGNRVVCFDFKGR